MSYKTRRAKNFIFFFYFSFEFGTLTMVDRLGLDFFFLLSEEILKYFNRVFSAFFLFCFILSFVVFCVVYSPLDWEVFRERLDVFTARYSLRNSSREVGARKSISTTHRCGFSSEVYMCEYALVSIQAYVQADSSASCYCVPETVCLCAYFMTLSASLSYCRQFICVQVIFF